MFTLLLKNPIGSLAYLCLIVAILSIWINRWIWIGLFAASYVLAYYSGILELQTLIPTGVIFVCFALLREKITRFWRFFAAMIGAIVSIGLFTHFITGFHNILLFPNWRSAPDAVPMNIYLNYDKLIPSLCILGLYLPLISSKEELHKLILKTVFAFIVTAVILLGLSYSLGIIKVDMKLPMITPLWLVIQLFFVTLPEEVFYRGFIQREIALNLPNKASGALAVLVTSLLFTLQHIFFIRNPSFLLLVFIAGLLYGATYQWTKSIESSIFVHYMVNVCHFFFFTYPMLAA